MIDESILNKNILNFASTMGTHQSVLYTEHKPMCQLRIIFSPWEVLELIHIDHTSYIDWGDMVIFIYYKPSEDNAVIADNRNSLRPCVYESGHLDNSKWSIIEQLFIKIENTFATPLSFEWWEIVNKMKEFNEFNKLN